MAARIAHGRREYARELPELPLRAPEAAETEHGHLRAKTDLTQLSQRLPRRNVGGGLPGCDKIREEWA